MNKKKCEYFAWFVVLIITAMALVPVSADNTEELFMNISVPLTSQQYAAYEVSLDTQNSQLSPIDINAFQKLSETDLEKIDDQDLLNFVQTIRQQASAAQKGPIAPAKVFKVLFKYDSDERELIQALAASLGIADIYFYKYTNMFSVVADANQLVKLLQNNQNIIRIQTDKLSTPEALTLGAATEAITHVSMMHQAGYDGADAYVAILDTGLDASNPEFGGRVTHEHCWSSPANLLPDLLSIASCTDSTRTMQLTESESAYPYWGELSSSWWHGSHVTGIAAGNGGIAPKANIIALQVFSNFTVVYGEQTNLALSWDSDQMKALEYLIDLRQSGLNIVAFNMSLGGGSCSGYCEDDPRKPLFDLLAELGTIPVVAAGNSYYDGFINYPACIPSAFSIGALNFVNNKPEIASFSNHALAVDLLAPGVNILSTILDGSYAYGSGTSMATPMVTGAIALIAGKIPETTGASVQSFLQKVSTQSATRDQYTRKILDFSKIPKILEALKQPWWTVGDTNQSNQPVYNFEGTVW